jgi:hypothetical protein
LESDYDKYIIASISEISMKGLMIVKFSKEIKVFDNYSSSINETTMTIELKKTDIS